MSRSPNDDSELLEVIGELGEDERRVLLALARRLAMGRKAYGPLDVQGDRRDWRRERADELADALIYGAIAEVAATLGAKPCARDAEWSLAPDETKF